MSELYDDASLYDSFVREERASSFEDRYGCSVTYHYRPYVARRRRRGKRGRNTA